MAQRVDVVVVGMGVGGEAVAGQPAEAGLSVVGTEPVVPPIDGLRATPFWTKS